MFGVPTVFTITGSGDGVADDVAEFVTVRGHAVEKTVACEALDPRVGDVLMDLYFLDPEPRREVEVSVDGLAATRVDGDAVTIGGVPVTRDMASDFREVVDHVADLRGRGLVVRATVRLGTEAAAD